MIILIVIIILDNSCYFDVGVGGGAILMSSNHKHCFSTEIPSSQDDIALDKALFSVNTFLISRQKHMLWVLIRSASQMLLRNKENFLLDTHSYQNLCCFVQKRKKKKIGQQKRNDSSDYSLYLELQLLFTKFTVIIVPFIWTYDYCLQNIQ